MGRYKQKTDEPDTDFEKFIADCVEECGGNGNKKNTNPKDRLSKDRLDLSLFPVIARAYGALAMTEGGLKYAPYNWREPGQGVRATVYYAACSRHLDKWLSREWEDPETGVPHLASALACIAILIDAVETDSLNDDRPKFLDGDKDVFAGVTDMLTEKAKHLHRMFPQDQDTEPSSPPSLKHCDADDAIVCQTCGAGKPAHPNGACPLRGSWIPTTGGKYKREKDV